ncbi:MAG: WD40 repeat domain-containing serine/threonine-protein kinase, partial [Planctomycetota bacterium]
MSDSATPPLVSLDQASESSDDGWHDTSFDQYFVNLESIAGYKVIRHLGQGGSSDVFLCEQASPNRQVALKLLKVSQCDERRQRRFQLEIDLLATLDHAGIAHIYDVGVADVGRGPQPYYTMEYVGGQRLDHFLESQTFEGFCKSQRIQLFLQIADAVGCAHQQGVVHRDLKPSNILVTETAGTLRIKVIDFGLARLSDPNSTVAAVTRTGHLVGTPMYMSPEQFKEDQHLADHRSDVYSLGLVLYEMLSGQQPYDLADKKAIVEIANVVLEHPPIPLGRIRSDLKGDLETILSKALEKDPTHRYQSLAAFVDELRLVLEGEPINTRRPSFWSNIAKWYLRTPRVALTVTATAILLLATSVVATVTSVIAHHRKAESEYRAELLRTSSLELAEANRELTEFAHDSHLSTSNATLMRTALSREFNPSLTRSLLYDTSLIPITQRNFVWQVLARQSDWLCTEGHWQRGAVLASAFSEDGSAVVLAAANAVDIRRADDLSIEWSFNEALSHPTIVALGPCLDRVAYRKPDRSIHLRGRAGREHFILCDGETESGHSLAFSSTGKIAVGLQGGRIKVWDDPELSPAEYQVAKTSVVGVRFSEDESELFTAAADGSVQNVRLADGEVLHPSKFEAIGMLSARFSQDGRYVAGGRRYHYVRVWDRKTGELLAKNTNPGPYVACDVFANSDWRMGLATRSRVELIRPGDQRIFLRLGSTPVHSLCASPDGSQMLVGDDGGNVHVFRTSHPDVPRSIPMASDRAGVVRFLSDSQSVVVCSGSDGVDIYNLESGGNNNVNPQKRGLIVDAELDPSGETLYYSVTEKRVSSWNLTADAPGEVDIPVTERIVDLAISSEQNKLFGVTKLGSLWTFDLKEKQSWYRSSGHHANCSAIVLSPDSSEMFTADESGSIRRWNTDSMKAVKSAKGDGSRIHELAISKNGAFLAAACRDGYVRVYESKTLRQIAELIVHTSAVRSLDFSPDGSTLATGGLDSQLILWDTEVWQPQSVWNVPGTGIRS